ncbi:unnamed protein product [Symbiodinium natans]|uniref:Uncharacterized protein n=1 Tax=Symbiodinium natans TaxID=878477 RepID=A0A812S4M0_9DINO|nr:unnamed protein product [Symbiodinium natans]
MSRPWLVPGSSLEVLASLCEHLSAEAGKGAKEVHAKHGKHCCAGSVMARLSSHVPAVLRFVRHGLHRRPEPGDVSVRSSALDAARALQRAGIGGHPTAMATATFAALFTDHAMRRTAGLLLQALARSEPQAVAVALPRGLREGFAALLWLAPQKLLLGATPTDVSSNAFAASGRVARGKWIHAMLAEMQSQDFLEGDFPPLPMDLSNRGPSRLAPFGGRRKAEDITENWPRQARLRFLYGQFLALQLLSLPLSTAATSSKNDKSEIGIIFEECTRFLGLRSAAHATAVESEGMGNHTVLSCISAVLCKAVLAVLSEETSERGQKFQAALRAAAPVLAAAATGDSKAALQCLAEAAEGADSPSPRPKRVRGKTSLGDLSARKKRRMTATTASKKGEASP